MVAADELPCFFRDAFVETSFTDEQLLISDSMLQMWTDFARFGDPNGDPSIHHGQVLWSPGQTMVFGVSREITTQQEWRDRMFLWDRLYWQTKRETLADIVEEIYGATEIVHVPTVFDNDGYDYNYEENMLPVYLHNHLV